jgi:hypothetical protein
MFVPMKTNATTPTAFKSILIPFPSLPSVTTAHHLAATLAQPMHSRLPTAISFLKRIMALLDIPVFLPLCEFYTNVAIVGAA